MSERDHNISPGVSVSGNVPSTEFTALQRRRRLIAERLSGRPPRDVEPSLNNPR
jgi:hypothetical protein